MPLYAAYGSNLDPAQMGERCPHSPLQGVGWLPGWRLTFGGEEYGWDGALPTLVEDERHQVFVAVYDVSPDDESRLDEWEGLHTNGPALYRKVNVRIEMLEGDRLAWVYVLDAYEGGLPSASTLSIMSEAAQAAGAPDDYVAELRSRECRSIGP